MITQTATLIFSCVVLRGNTMDSPLLKSTSTGHGAQVPVSSGPVTAGVPVAGHSGWGPFRPVTQASWTRHLSLLDSASTGPGTLTPRLHLPLFTGLRVAAHAQRGRKASQELAVKWSQASAMVPAVHALNLSDLKAPAAVSGALAPVSHLPAGARAEVAFLSRVGPLEGCTVGVHLRAAHHASPVGAQPTRGGALTPVSNNPICVTVVLSKLPVIRGIQQKAFRNQNGGIFLSQNWSRALCLVHVWKL